jgi:hypothetical protein
MRWLTLYHHSDLVRVRSALVSQALDSGAEVIIFADADTIPVGDALIRIAAQATPARAVFGLYMQRDGERLSVEVTDPPAASAAMAAGELFPIVYGGLGLVAVHRASLQRVAASLPTVTSDALAWQPFCLPFVLDGVYHGDDRSLCHRLASTGTELWADPTLDVRHAITTLAAVQPSGVRRAQSKLEQTASSASESMTGPVAAQSPISPAVV